MCDIDKQLVRGCSVAFVWQWSDVFQSIAFGQQVVCNTHNLFEFELSRSDIEKKAKVNGTYLSSGEIDSRS